MGDACHVPLHLVTFSQKGNDRGLERGACRIYGHGLGKSDVVLPSASSTLGMYTCAAISQRATATDGLFPFKLVLSSHPKVWLIACRERSIHDVTAAAQSVPLAPPAFCSATAPKNHMFMARDGSVSP